MKVHAIQKCIEEYLRFLDSRDAARWDHLHALIRHFHAHWDPSAEDIGEVYGNCLRNDVSRRLWLREHFDARQMMLRFIGMEPDYVRQMFRDLHDESRAIEARMDRFRFYADELLQLLKARSGGRMVTGHDQDASVISFYLAGMYPDVYAIYPGLGCFREALDRFGSPQPVEFDDLGRFFKVCRALDTLGRKNDRLAAALGRRFRDQPESAGYLQWTSEMMLSMCTDTPF